MPRPTLPPTPASSTDLKAQQSSILEQPDQKFILPPSAVVDSSMNRSSTANTKDSTSSVVTIGSPTSSETLHGATSSHTRKVNRGNVELPPPPARSRKIIQVQPKAKSQGQSRSSTSSQPRRSSRAAEAQSADKTDSVQTSRPQSVSSSGTATGKKSGNSSTAAGRKVARKTAHSIIERKRRSKMNEEFGVLKDLIPACRGYEMHKLAILQASVDYVRYLKRCVSELKLNQVLDTSAELEPSSLPERWKEGTRLEDNANISIEGSKEAHEANEHDNEMDLDEPETEQQVQEESGAVLSKRMSNASTASSVSETTAVTSPAFSSYSHSLGQPSTATFPSPYFGPIYSHDGRPQSKQSNHEYYSGRLSYSSSAHASPSIPPLPQSHEQSADLSEASAALLMLNARERRNTMTSVSASAPQQPPKPKAYSQNRGISVKDLLSS